MYYKFPKEKSDDALKASDKLVDYLSRRDHSEKELREKLGRRFTADAIRKALEEAKERRWLKEPEELAELVAERLHLKGKGYRYIQKYLQDKGLPPVDRTPDREKEKAHELLSVKFGDYQSLSYEERQKAFRFLSSRGYHLDTIRSLF